MAGSKWDIMTAHARITFAEELDPDLASTLGQIPGIKSKYGAWAVSHHAIAPLKAFLRRYDLRPETIHWVRPKPEDTPWEQVEKQLRESGEVRDFVLDGFLTNYQKSALSFGWRRQGFHLWHPTGSGKSLTGLLSGLAVSRRPILIVTRAPSRLQYAREVMKFTNLVPYVVRPKTQKRKKAKKISEYRQECKELGRREVIIVGWPSLPQALPALLAYGFGAVIFDELHTAKASKRYDSLVIPDPQEADSLAEAKKLERKEQELLAEHKGSFVKTTEHGRRLFVPLVSIASCAAELARHTYKRIGMTATPVKDRTRDLWGQLDVIEPNSWGSASLWQDRYADRKPGTYGGFDTRGSSNVEELQVRLRSVAHIMRYEDTHRELPAKRRQSFYIAPDDQVRPLGSFTAELKAAHKRGATAVLETKLAMAASMKRKAVVQLAEDHFYEKHKITIFTARKKDCEDLRETLLKSAYAKANELKVWSIDGSKTMEMRQAILDEYMSTPGPCVLVATGQSSGESLNIQDTDAAMFVMLPYTPGQLRQWEGRFHRHGMQRPVVIYYVIAEGTADEHVASILIDKLPAVEKLAQDQELASAKTELAGYDGFGTDEEFAQSILAMIDDDEG
jgi:superfamily II DNA or RNA helicase